jgi:4-carboxymuconolactone decarboxylase
MARIRGISAEDASPEVKQVYDFARQGMAQLTGRSPERGIEPFEMYAHLPGLFRGVLALVQSTGELHGVDRRLHALVSLKAATLTNCEYCIDLGSQVSRQWGLSDEELLALPAYRTSNVFTEVEKLVLDYATGMSRTPVDVSDDLFARLREHFDEAQIVELTHLIALENLYGRFNLALGIGAAGYSEGMVCAVPAMA